MMTKNILEWALHQRGGPRAPNGVKTCSKWCSSLSFQQHDAIAWGDVLLTDPKYERADGQTSLFMFVVRVLLGNVFICRKPTPFRKPPCTGQNCHKDNCVDLSHQPSFHSVVGTHGSDDVRLIFRDFVIYETSQAYAEFLVEYERQ